MNDKLASATIGLFVVLMLSGAIAIGILASNKERSEKDRIEQKLDRLLKIAEEYEK